MSLWFRAYLCKSVTYSCFTLRILNLFLRWVIRFVCKTHTKNKPGFAEVTSTIHSRMLGCPLNKQNSPKRKKEGNKEKYCAPGEIGTNYLLSTYCKITTTIKKNYCIFVSSLIYVVFPTFLWVLPSTETVPRFPGSFLTGFLP